MNESPIKSKVISIIADELGIDVSRIQLESSLECLGQMN